ncbi:MAG: tetratricopeptide repeat protein [Pirellulaceae bacterium]
MNEQTIFTAAIDRDPAERPAFLDRACGTDQSLRQRVEKLIGLHENAGDFLEQPAAGAGPTYDQRPPERLGTQIGRYRLLQQIGEGGMGTVFMAEQTQPVQRRVALKIIKVGMDTRQVIARFEAEKQALAIMDHANIARVIDAGTTEQGRPYFVMELVHGVPITQYCDDNRLTPRERLELFMPVCQAIQHAHQKGIIHRDIKPSNVLVTLYDGKPVPKVIDFGVAKATEQKLTERTLFTQYGTMVGTLEYMSPEQAEMNALGVDTRSDIYSLGVLLYELLTGSTPLTQKRLKDTAYTEILRIIKEEDPPKPSTRLSDSREALAAISAQRHTEPAKLSKLMRGELDWIVMKTLEKDRNRRYETANGFAADVQRYLNDEPVQACPPSANYRFRKLARRNKRSLATVGVVAVAVLISATALGWSVRDREAREQQIALETSRRLAVTEEGIRQALDRATRSRADLNAILKNPGGVQQLLNQPARWELLLKTARGELGQARRLTAHADGVLDPEWVHVMDRLERHFMSDQADFDLAHRLEKICLDKATWVEGRFDFRKSSDEYRMAFAGLAVLTGDPAAVAARISSSPIKDQLVASLDDWARVEWSLGKEDMAERILAVARQAAPDSAWGDRLRQLKVWRDQEALGKLVAEAPAARLSPQFLALVGSLLGDANAPLKESWKRQAQAAYPADFWLNYGLASDLLQTNPEEAVGYYRVALAVRPGSSAAYNNLGNALDSQQKLPEAIAAYRKAIEIDPKHDFAYNNLGLVLAQQKKLPEAIAAYRKAIELNPRNLKAYGNIASVLKEQHRLDEAIDYLRKAIELDPKSTYAYGALGDVFLEQQRLDEATASYRKIVALDPKSACAHNTLGVALDRQGELDEAIACFAEAVKCAPQFALGHSNLGAALEKKGNLDDAVASYRKAIAIDPKFAPAHGGLGLALHRQKKLDEALACYRSAVELDPHFADAHTNLGIALYDQNRLDEAIASYRKAIEIDPLHTNAHYNLANALRDQGNLDEAIAACRKAIVIDPVHRSAYYNLGLILAQQKKLPEAIAAYRKALEIDPEFTHAQEALGNALMNESWDLADSPDLTLRDPQRAVEACREAVELVPQSVNAWQYLGWVQYRAGNWQASIEALEKSCKLQEGGTGDACQWIVMSLAHGQRAHEKKLPEQERQQHQAKARLWYEQAVKQIDSWGPGENSLLEAARTFRTEAAELLVVEVKPK